MHPFSKYAGCGNDFILIDNRSHTFPSCDPSHISHLCDRLSGLGADGVILLENSAKADFRMRIFNADGGEAEMCGNGIRCLFKFLQELGHTHPSYSIETMKKCLLVASQGDLVKVEMGDPIDVRWNVDIPEIPALASFSQTKMHVLNTGVPHAVLFFDDLEGLPFDELGSRLRHHPFFSPRGTNVNAALIDQKGQVWVRTFERGVEGETLACGTGATAAALAAAKIYGLRSPVRVIPKSLEELEVGFQLTAEQNFTQVTLTGPAKKLPLRH